MAISKITLNGVTQMDVTGKTVTSGSMLNGITALKNDGTDITGNIASKSSSDLTVSGATVTAPAGYYGSAASKTIPDATLGTTTSNEYYTENGERKWRYRSVVYCDSQAYSNTNPGYVPNGFEQVSNFYTRNAIAKNTSITPTESAQTIGGANTMMEGAVTVNAIPSNYVGSGITQRSSSDLTASGATVTAPAGYYGSAATKSVAAGSATTPATTVTANPSISVSSGGLITATASATKSVTPTVSAGYVSSGTAGTITVSGSNTSQLSTQAAQTIYPSTSDQTLTSGIYLTGAQTIKAVKITNLSAENIAAGVTVEIGDADDSDRIISVTGTMPNPSDVTIYTTAANVFNSPHAQVTSYATVELTKNNQACTLYLYMQPTRWTTMGSGAVLGTLKDDFVPAGKSGTTAYVIFPLLSNTTPYAPCGSVWVYTQGTNRGKVIAYFDSSATPGYLFLNYIAGAQT